MDTGMLHTHTLMVSLYILLLGIKTVLLLMGKRGALISFTHKVRIPSIVISVLMLATGIYLVVKSPNGMQPYVMAKLGLVLASIPLGIIGFKKLSVPLALLSFLFTAGAMGLAYAKPSFLQSGSSTQVQAGSGEDQATLDAGGVIYGQKCQTCHGPDGTSGFQGAKNLQTSVLGDDQVKEIVRNGKGIMPAEKDLSDQDLAKLIAYVKHLRK